MTRGDLSKINAGNADVPDEPDALSTQESAPVKARTAGVRADELEAAFITALDAELQNLRDEYRQVRDDRDRLADRINEVLPRLAELTQACRTAKQQSALATGSSVLGGVFLGFRLLLVNDPSTQALLTGIGASLLFVGFVLQVVSNRFGWPTHERDSQSPAIEADEIRTTRKGESE